jgi:hypothetical protein
MVWLPIQFPADAAGMAFDFRVSGDPGDDSLVCGIGTNNLFSLQAKYTPTNSMSTSSLIDLSAWAGTTNELFFGFLGDTSTNATLEIDNIRFYSVLPPSLNAQMVNSNIVISWPASATAYTLEATSGLAGPSSWSSVTNIPIIVGDKLFVTNQISTNALFYRLRQ